MGSDTKMHHCDNILLSKRNVLRHAKTRNTLFFRHLSFYRFSSVTDFSCERCIISTGHQLENIFHFLSFDPILPHLICD